MKVLHKTLGGTTFIGLCGELDESTSVITRSALDKIIDASDSNKVILDLSSLKFMDSTGVGVLLGRYKRLKSKGSTVFIVSPNPTIDKLLKLSGIYEIMPLIDTELA
mgnify:FL=1